MGNVSLLNENPELKLAKDMLHVVNLHKMESAKRLTHVLLAPDAYLKTFGAHQEVETLFNKLEDMYKRATQT